MKKEKIFIAEKELIPEYAAVSADFTMIDNEEFLCIRNYDAMPPFFMTLVSDSDHWMYISSRGGLTAGRINPDSAIFPYYTDDKIHDTSGITGSKSIFLVEKNEKTWLWEPFTPLFKNIYNISRNLYKSRTGNKLIFEEINHDLDIAFRYGWMNSERFGWVRKVRLLNHGKETLKIRVLDGLQNILPYGLQSTQQALMSTLMDGYKKCETVPGLPLAIFRLSSIPVDRAEPSEALKATTVWATGPDKALILLSNRQMDKFREGSYPEAEPETRGEKGAFFLVSDLTLKPGDSRNWYMVAEVNQDAADLRVLVDLLGKENNLPDLIEKDIASGSDKLIILVGKADGLQQSGDKRQDTRHFANVLFNIMRGGIYHNGYLIDKTDFLKHVETYNSQIFMIYESLLKDLPDEMSYKELVSILTAPNDPDLTRIMLEYLPLTFSRRHGDPSRPWNKFSIDIKGKDGQQLLSYQGNWRDIFQNWEALNFSYPGYIRGIISRFLNASTVDGYNPYRVTRQGIDWEVEDPDDPWSFIGYWGDHQVIYLLKLLEQLHSFYPGELEQLMDREWFAFANVPYRIKPYSEIVKDPKQTITFDARSSQEALNLAEKLGADGKLVQDPEGRIVKTSLTEKLLITLLTKLSNFIPEAGIWLNTQRPEWNDANNALVGNGASMVTLYYMRRFINFLLPLFRDHENHPFNISEEVGEFFDSLESAFLAFRPNLEDGFNDSRRRAFTDQAGEVGSAYREKVYRGFSQEKRRIMASRIVGFLELILEYADQSIRANRRDDGLYHAYNLVTFSADGISVSHLQKMLEGQVALLSSGKPGPEEVVRILDAMRQSDLYREDQQSYLLYPDRKLPVFLDKNNITPGEIASVKLLEKLTGRKDQSVITRDLHGDYHFNGTFRNSKDLDGALQVLKEKGMKISSREHEEVLKFFEQKFDHQSFTGRSGTFFKYEGLGSIYWHMVSKLLLAVGENTRSAVKSGAPGRIVEAMKQHYSEIKKGIGIHKDPSVYGAFPTDPYSHTPSMMGAQQPGMTGQVKEDIISRIIELGIDIRDGRIHILPGLIIQDPGNTPGKPFVSFTFCSVPFVYHIGETNRITITASDGTIIEQADMVLPEGISAEIFGRTGKIEKIIVELVLKG